MSSCCVLSLRRRSGGGEGSFSGLGSAKHADWVEVRFVETFSPGYVTAEISGKVERFWYFGHAFEIKLYSSWLER